MFDQKSHKTARLQPHSPHCHHWSPFVTLRSGADARLRPKWSLRCHQEILRQSLHCQVSQFDPWCALLPRDMNGLHVAAPWNVDHQFITRVLESNDHDTCAVEICGLFKCLVCSSYCPSKTRLSPRTCILDVWQFHLGDQDGSFKFKFPFLRIGKTLLRLDNGIFESIAPFGQQAFWFPA